MDDDCDGATDESDAAGATPWYRDADGDGYGTDADVQTACGQPAGYVAQGGDCNDALPGVNPGEVEVCDGRDEDCSGVVDDPHWYPDGDGDGYGVPAEPVITCESPEGYTSNNTDCDDTDAGVHPGAAEICDDGCQETGSEAAGFGCDQDCDGRSDDADPDVIDATQSWLDADGDGFGDDGIVSPAACESPDENVPVAGDCDDGDSAVHPGAIDTCYDGVDSDCDAFSDDDCDHDGFDRDAGGDCDDDDAWVNPDALDACSNTVDEDCDGSAVGDCALAGTPDLEAVGFRLTGDTSGQHAGMRVRVGDVDGDGSLEILAGAPLTDVDDISDAGVIMIYSHATTDDSLSAAGTRLSGDVEGLLLGTAFALLDYNGDGVTDIVAGSPYAREYSGEVRSFEGPLSGDLSWGSPDWGVVSPSTSQSLLGYAVAAADLNGDGYDEGLVSAPLAEVDAHSNVGPGAKIGAQAGVRGNIPAGESWVGSPAMPIGQTSRIFAAMKDLPAMW